MQNLVRFGVFVFDRDQLTLTRDGRPVRVQHQPARVLSLLLERAGRLVTRDELRAAVWGDATFVDFDRGLNFCIGQIRSALGDSAESPRYIRTLPKRGYEFICPVTSMRPSAPVEPAGSDHPAEFAVPDRSETARPKQPRTGARRLKWVWASAGSAILLASLIVGFAAHRRGTAHLPTSSAPTLPAPVVIAVARFDNETDDPSLTRFADYLTDNLVEELTVDGAGRYGVVGNAAVLRGTRDRRDLSAINASLHADYVVLGQVQGDNRRVRILGHLIKLPEQTHVSVARFDDVRERTLATAGDLAARIARKFDARLIAGSRSNSPIPATH